MTPSFADALIAASAELFGVREVATFDRAAAQRLGWRLLEPAGA
jgi:predicted nucleic-acid-binding protein